MIASLIQIPYNEILPFNTVLYLQFIISLFRSIINNTTASILQIQSIKNFIYRGSLLPFICLFMRERAQITNFAHNPVLR